MLCIFQAVRETVFVLLIQRVGQDVGVEDVGKVNAAKDVGLFGCGEIHIYKHSTVSTMCDGVNFCKGNILRVSLQYSAQRVFVQFFHLSVYQYWYQYGFSRNLETPASHYLRNMYSIFEILYSLHPI